MHVERLLAELEGVEGEGRRARYVCELVALSPEGEEARGTGILEGRIADEPRGSEGFGFDPIFVPEGEERTVAELGDEWKAENSHRARAADALLGAATLEWPRRLAKAAGARLCRAGGSQRKKTRAAPAAPAAPLPHEARVRPKGGARGEPGVPPRYKA